MTYKNYKIINIIVNQNKNYIRFELDGDIEFRNGKQNFIFSINQYPFIDYRVNSEIEIDLTDAKHLNTNNYHHKLVRTTTSMNIPIDDYSQQWQGEKER
jgi:hypothetical protein